MTTIARVIDALSLLAPGRDHRPRDRLQHWRGLGLGRGRELGLGLGLGHRLADSDLHGQPDVEQLVHDLIAALTGSEPTTSQIVRIAAEAPIAGPPPRGCHLTTHPRHHYLRTQPNRPPGVLGRAMHDHLVNR